MGKTGGVESSFQTTFAAARLNRRYFLLLHLRFVMLNHAMQSRGSKAQNLIMIKFLFLLLLLFIW